MVYLLEMDVYYVIDILWSPHVLCFVKRNLLYASCFLFLFSIMGKVCSVLAGTIGVFTSILPVSSVKCDYLVMVCFKILNIAIIQGVMEYSEWY